MNKNDENKSKAEIRELIEKVWDAACKADVERIFTFFTDTLPVGVIYGALLPTREDFMSTFRQSFARIKNQDFEIKDSQIAILAPTVAVATNYIHFTSYYKDGTSHTGDIRVTLVLVKEGSDWKFMHLHES